MQGPPGRRQALRPLYNSRKAPALQPIKIVTLDDERIHIPFNVPNGNGEPMLIKLPRFDFLTEEQFDEMTAELEEIDKDTELAGRKRGRKIALTMLRHVTTDAQYEALGKLAMGQLDQIVEEWRNRSQISLGESDSSATSSASTAEPSTATSSTTVGDAAISEDA
jgi:hypothetical protein